MNPLKLNLNTFKVIKNANLDNISVHRIGWKSHKPHPDKYRTLRNWTLLPSVIKISSDRSRNQTEHYNILKNQAIACNKQHPQNPKW